MIKAKVKLKEQTLFLYNIGCVFTPCLARIADVTRLQ